MGRADWDPPGGGDFAVFLARFPSPTLTLALFSFLTGSKRLGGHPKRVHLRGRHVSHRASAGGRASGPLSIRVAFVVRPWFKLLST